MKKNLFIWQEFNKVNYLFILFLTGSLLSGCATTEVADDSEIGHQTQFQSQTTGVVVPTDESQVSDEQQVDEEESNKDPLEDFNRAMYGFNEAVDDYVAEPISSGYQWLFPQFVQTGVANFYDNFKNISVVLNDFLQGKFIQGSEDTGRFLLNTTIGIGGLFDVATHVGLEQNNEDFGQTLAVWGVPAGPYIVVPFLGPTTARGVPGAVVDAAANPITYLPWGFAAVGALNKRANAQGALQFIDEAALDPYVFTRESYLQWRDFLATDGNPEFSDDDLDFDDELFDDEEVGESDVTEQAVVDDGLQSNEAVLEPGGLEASENLDQPGATPTEQTASTSVQKTSELEISAEINNDDQVVVSGQADELVVIIQGESDDAIVGSNKQKEVDLMRSFDQASQSFDAASKAYEEAAKELSDLQAQN